jgi:hypothetical protein
MYSAADLITPGQRHHAIVPGPEVLSPKPRAIWCQTAGDVTVVDEAGTSLVYTVSQGQVLDFRAHRITASTATLYGWI